MQPPSTPPDVVQVPLEAAAEDFGLEEEFDATARTPELVDEVVDQLYAEQPETPDEPTIRSPPPEEVVLPVEVEEILRSVPGSPVDLVPDGGDIDEDVVSDVSSEHGSDKWTSGGAPQESSP